MLIIFFAKLCVENAFLKKSNQNRRVNIPSERMHRHAINRELEGELPVTEPIRFEKLDLMFVGQPDRGRNERSRRLPCETMFKTEDDKTLFKRGALLNKFSIQRHLASITKFVAKNSPII